MKAAIICNDKDIYNDLKKTLNLDIQEYDHYLDFQHFKEFYMLYYDFLIIPKSFYEVLSHDERKEISEYCDKKAIKLFIQEISEEKIILENIAVDEQALEADDSLDTVELKPTQYTKNNTVVEKLEVIKTVYAHSPQRNVAIVSLTSGAGSTFIALTLAQALSDLNISIGVIEPPIGEPYIFDYIGLHQKLFKNNWIDIEDYLFVNDIFDQKDMNKKKEIIQEHIHWLIVNPLDTAIEDWDADKMIHLINASKRASLNIIDIGNHFEHPAIYKMLHLLDMILVIIDPLPPEILQGEKRLKLFQNLKNEGCEVEFIINKFNKGINIKELIGYLGVKPMMSFPIIESKLIYEAVYQCKIPYSIDILKTILKKEIDLLIKKVIPEELIKKDNAGFLFFKNSISKN